MRILMTASDERAAARSRAVLEDSGHEVLACTGPGGHPFPCRGVAGDTCPIDAGAVVAVSCPASLPPEPQAGDVGLVCALRHHLPVLVVTSDDTSWSESPFERVTVDDLPAAAERAAAADLPAHTAAVLVEARRVAGDRATASVTRTPSGLLVVIDLPGEVDDPAAQAIAVRAQAAIRRIDPWAASIDVRVGAR